MRVLLHLLIFTCLTASVFGQIKKSDLVGNWVKYKAERVDGSRIIDRYDDGESYMEISIKNNSYCVQLTPLEKDCLTYKLKNNIIEAGNFLKYEITLFKDSLLVLETINPKLSKDRLNKYYFLPKEKIIKETHIKMDGDIAIMDTYTCPIFKGDFKNRLSQRLQGKYTNTNFNGYFEIDHNTKSVSTKITDNDGTRKKVLEITKNFINSTYNEWDYKIAHKKLRIYFVCQIKSGQFSSLNFNVNTQEYYIPSNKKSNNITISIKESNNLFTKGLANYQNEKYELAVKNFTKSYELNPFRIDAIYNRAAIYQAMGNMEKACEDWKHLADLEQKDALKYLDEHCD